MGERLAPLAVLQDDGVYLDGRARGTARGEDERLVARVHQPGHPAEQAPIPEDLHPRSPRRSGAAGSVAVHPSGAGLGQRDARRRHDRHDRHRERQVVVLQPARAARARGRPPSARALPLPHQGARAGSGAQPPGAPDLRSAPRDLRRRHAAGGAGRDQALATWCSPIRTCSHVGILPHHAGWGDFFANLALVIVDEAHVYRGVFGSHVGERAAPAATARRCVRDAATIRAHIGDDRKSARHWPTS